MQALLLSDYRRLELVELPTPVPGPGEVLIRVAACGICGSDVHGYDGSSGRRRPPLVMGHEAAGIVAALGPGAANLREGDRVTLDSTIYCGTCRFCQRGLINLCDRREVLGVSCSDYRRAGAFAEYVVVPARVVHSLPDQLSFVEAAMLEAVAVAVHAVGLTELRPKSSVLVVGAGTIGLLVVAVLRTLDCSHILVTDVDETRLGLARRMGASGTILAGDRRAVDQVLELAGGCAVDAAVEAVGRDETVNFALSSVTKGGQVTLVGNISDSVRLPLQKVVTRQIRLQGSCASAGEYPRAIALLGTGAIDVKPLITGVAALAEGPRWFERLYAGEPNLLKVVLTPGTPS